MEPDKMLSWRGVTFGGSAVHVWQMERRDGFTCVRVEESMDGWLIKLFKKKMNNDLRQDMQYWLEGLKRECEKA